MFAQFLSIVFADRSIYRRGLSELFQHASSFRVGKRLLVSGSTFEHKISDRERLKRYVGSHPDNFPTPFLGVVLIETIYFYFVQIEVMPFAGKNERLVVKNHGAVFD